MAMEETSSQTVCTFSVDDEKVKDGDCDASVSQFLLDLKAVLWKEVCSHQPHLTRTEEDWFQFHHDFSGALSVE